MTKGFAAIPRPVAKDVWRRLYRALDEYSHPEATADRSVTVHAAAADWLEERGLRRFYSGVFAPYFKDTTAEPGKDKKKTFQFFEVYYRFLNQERADLFEDERFRQLVDGSMAALYSVHAAVHPFVAELRDVNPELYRALSPENALPPVSLRLLRYERTDSLGIRPHIDKSGLTVILDSDDPADETNLVFGPLDPSLSASLDSFRPLTCRQDESLIFFGGGLRAAGFQECRPLPHTVRPFRRAVRHSAVFHWFLPNLETETLHTKLEGFETTA